MHMHYDASYMEMVNSGTMKVIMYIRTLWLYDQLCVAYEFAVAGEPTE